MVRSLGKRLSQDAGRVYIHLYLHLFHEEYSLQEVLAAGTSTACQPIILLFFFGCMLAQCLPQPTVTVHAISLPYTNTIAMQHLQCVVLQLIVSGVLQ